MNCGHALEDERTCVIRNVGNNHNNEAQLKALKPSEDDELQQVDSEVE
jgi:hypothetical protein